MSMFKGFNCLPGHDPDFLRDMILVEGAIGLDIRYCRNESTDPEETYFNTFEPREAQIAALYLVNGAGLAEALHDVDYGTPEGEREMAEAVAAAMAMIFWVQGNTGSTKENTQ